MPKVSQEYLDTRRREILDGARRAFSRWGYDGATVKRLEEETGLSRGAIFNYFENKQDLFVELAYGESSRYVELLIGQGIDATFREMAGESSEWLGVLIEIQSRLRHDEDFVRRMDERTTDGHEREKLLAWIAAAQADGTMRTDIDDTELARFVTIVLNGLALRVAGGDPTEIESLLRLLHDALAPRQ
jgi:TetR/AcrR family transcriptional regulator, transcriptional repressor of aconitase